MIIVITGPTATGKTLLSETLAKKYNALIVNADSRQIYKELNIGTAKPSSKELDENHYLFDCISINDEYNAFNYQEDVRKIIKKNPDKNIILVGGTGLYIKSALYDYDFKSDNKNKLLYDAIFIGLTTDRENLYKRINERVDVMFKQGLLDEAKELFNKYKDNKILNNTIGYQEFKDYFDNKVSLDEVKEKIKTNSRHYAKRQYTWFNNQMDINWIEVNYDNFNMTIDKTIKLIETR